MKKEKLEKEIKDDSTEIKKDESTEKSKQDEPDFPKPPPY